LLSEIGGEVDAGENAYATMLFDVFLEFCCHAISKNKCRFLRFLGEYGEEDVNALLVIRKNYPRDGYK